MVSGGFGKCSDGGAMIDFVGALDWDKRALTFTASVRCIE